MKTLPENQLSLLKKERERKPAKSNEDSFRDFLLNEATLSEEQIKTMKIPGIAAIALSNNLPIATLNKKHFDRIDDLVLLD